LLTLFALGVALFIGNYVIATTILLLCLVVYSIPMQFISLPGIPLGSPLHGKYMMGRSHRNG